MKVPQCIFLGYLWEVVQSIYEVNPAAIKIVGIEPQRSRSKEAIAFLEAHGISWIDVRGIRKNNHFIKILEDNIDLIVVGGFGQILDDKILRAPKHGVFNVHPSLLPHYRGGSPIEEQIIQGEYYGGVSIHRMTETVDSGDLLGQEEIVVGERYYEEILKDCASAAGRIVATALERGLDDVLMFPTPDIKDEPLYEPRGEADGVIMWTDTAEHVQRKVRAYGWKNIAVNKNAMGVLAVEKCEIIPMNLFEISPGLVLEAGPCPVIATSDQAIQLNCWSADFPIRKGMTLI